MRSPQENAELIAGLVRKSRRQLGYSRAAAARAINISEGTLFSLEVARKPIQVQYGKIKGYNEWTLERIESFLGWGWGSILDIAEGKIDEPWKSSEGSKPQRIIEQIPDVITLDWLAGMILRYKMQEMDEGVKA